MIKLNQTEVNLFVQELCEADLELREHVAEQLRESFEAFILANVKVDENFFEALINTDPVHLKTISERVADELLKRSKHFKVNVPEIKWGTGLSLKFFVTESSEELSLSWQIA